MDIRLGLSKKDLQKLKELIQGIIPYVTGKTADELIEVIVWIDDQLRK